MISRALRPLRASLKAISMFAGSQPRYRLVLPDGQDGAFEAPGEYVLEGEYWYRVDVSPRVRIEAWPLAWRSL